MDPGEFKRRFHYHPPSGEAKELHAAARAEVQDFATAAEEMIGGAPSRETALFWTNFEQATFWLHAHIARNASHEEDES